MVSGVRIRFSLRSTVFRLQRQKNVSSLFTDIDVILQKHYLIGNVRVRVPNRVFRLQRVSSDSPHHSQEVFLTQFSACVNKCLIHSFIHSYPTQFFPYPISCTTQFSYYLTYYLTRFSLYSTQLFCLVLSLFLLLPPLSSIQHSVF